MYFCRINRKFHTHNKMTCRMDQQKITKDSIEQAFCFFHQKWRVYEHSKMDWQKDDIEYAIAQYVEGMNQSLYNVLSQGDEHYLLSHDSFAKNMKDAIDKLDVMMDNRE